ncbi:nitroreductase family protein [Dissulfurirhabdus thermomarina]|uniref:Nitroreductase family protein n=1 Tax=Dissulfurirhabdus thermomarina TaxID=1765737 RepID=A0A6N9TMS6_DISTH|nr:nitroreductase [Dissulfurirhabdus thermomarina]NDY41373.1 nitroreductase family protein [Dissulfurirhabdus thermomarina]NMX23611.1 nitroreductase family protein [Dissulfurirhabdus thermomarina]
MHPVLQAIRERRSVRHFRPDPVDPETVRQILEAGAWAPSGLNNQPWRFAVVRDGATREALAALTRYARVIREAPVLLPVFVDRSVMYHEVKDHQAVGACLQNMLLAAHALGLGAVWLGEILKNADRVREILGLEPNLELMAVVAVGHPARRDQASTRRPLSELVVKEI